MGAALDREGAFPRPGSTTVVAIHHDVGTVELANAHEIVAFTDYDYLFDAGPSIDERLSSLEKWVADRDVHMDESPFIRLVRPESDEEIAARWALGWARRSLRQQAPEGAVVIGSKIIGVVDAVGVASDAEVASNPPAVAPAGRVFVTAVQPLRVVALVLQQGQGEEPTAAAVLSIDQAIALLRTLAEAIQHNGGVAAMQHDLIDRTVERQ